MRLIDADWVLAALGVFNDRKHGDAHFFNGIASAEEIVEHAPTIATRDWTPCSEGLPESGLKRADGSPKVYRVTVVDNNGLPIPITYECDATREYDTWITESSYEFEDWETVVAWFELPDPYRGDDITGKVKEEAE